MLEENKKFILIIIFIIFSFILIFYFLNKILFKNNINSLNKSKEIALNLNNEKENLKGWELYIYKKDSNNYFLLTKETNSKKFCESFSQIDGDSLEDLKGKLSFLQPGENLFFLNKDSLKGDCNMVLDEMPEDIKIDLIKYTNNLKLNFNLK